MNGEQVSYKRLSKGLKITWNDEDGGKLTHYICEKPTAVDTRKAVWIGLNDIQGTQTLVWTDDYPVTFTKW